MVQANIAARHRLAPRAGYDEMSHLQFTAPMAAADLNRDNGSGEDRGLPAGSVVSLDVNGNLTAGASGIAMPMFLLWNTADPDGYPTSVSTDGLNFMSVAANGAGNTSEGVQYSDQLTRNPYTMNASNTGLVQETGMVSSLQRAVSAGGTVSYSLKNSVGNFTAWPATCAMELTTTEFDFSDSAANFKPNTLLTSPGPDANAILEANPTTAQSRVYYQKRRGGFVKRLQNTDAQTLAVTAPFTGSYYTTTSGTTDTNTNVAGKVYNVIGTVSSGITMNENGVEILRFWADRLIIPHIQAAAPVEVPAVEVPDG